MNLFDTFIMLGMIGGAACLMWLGYWQLVAKARRRLMPMIARECWTDAEYAEYAARLDAKTLAPSGDLAWQAHCELQRLTDGAARLATNLNGWRAQARQMDDDLERKQEQAALALAEQKQDQARALIGERRLLQERRDRLAEDIDRSETTLAGYQREITALEGRLGDDFRQAALADARIAGARDTIRARQLMHGTLAEAAMARREQRERAAGLAEAEVEALDMTERSALERDLERLEVDAELGALRARRRD